ncbi:MAG: cache domain-containing protein, partial [Thermodesulfobacteriota bacterium]|nr:cache domain-containing protein [Thermodesulfobacteriota bacterium]
MSLKVKLKPAFWDHRDVAAGPYKHLFDFRRIWKLAVALTAGVAIVPLIALTVLDFNLTKRSVESEILMLTSRLVSNTWRTISFFMAEHKSALNFTIRDNTIEELNDPERLAVILENLKSAFGGFTDLGLIDSSGKQMAYVGPYDLTGKDYSGQDWFKEVMNRGSYISGVFLGFRNVPHMVIAVKQKTADGLCYVLRVTLDTERFNNILYHLKVSGQGDIFVVNHQGTLQTPSRYYGRVLEKISLPIPQYSKKTRVYQGKNNGGQALVIGYAYIPETPFILMIVKHKEALMKPWYITRLEVV